MISLTNELGVFKRKQPRRPTFLDRASCLGYRCAWWRVISDPAFAVDTSSVITIFVCET